MLKRLVKQRKHYLSLAKRIFSENRRPKIFSKNGRFSAKKGGLESSQFSLRTILVITFYIKVLKHSEKLSLQSSGTKNHWHLNIKAFVVLNPCPKLIEICITIQRIPQIPVNTCVHSHVLKYSQKSLWE